MFYAPGKRLPVSRALRRYGIAAARIPGYKLPTMRGRALAATTAWARDLLYLPA